MFKTVFTCQRCGRITKGLHSTCAQCGGKFANFDRIKKMEEIKSALHVGLLGAFLGPFFLGRWVPLGLIAEIVLFAILGAITGFFAIRYLCK